MIRIFTDGASRGNPGPGGWGAIIVNDERVVERGGREDVTTNNRMELLAVVSSLEYVSQQGVDLQASELSLYTDSRYVLKGATEWMYRWKMEGWKTKSKEPVLHQDLWVRLEKSVSKSSTFSWNLLPGHSGIPANERVDIIATAFADDRAIDLYSGPKHEYSVDTDSVEATKKKPVKKKHTGTAYSYLSLVGGELKRHTSWTECEKRVKGVSGAKFKKALSPQDEADIKRDWNVS